MLRPFQLTPGGGNGLLSRTLGKLGGQPGPSADGFRGTLPGGIPRYHPPHSDSRRGPATSKREGAGVRARRSLETEHFDRD